MAGAKSFVHRLLQESGAVFDEAGLAVGFGRDDEVEVASRMGLADLSLLPRTGFKGADAIAWLASRGITIGAAANRAYRQSDGLLAAKLAPGEALILAPLDGRAEAIERLDSAWSIDTAGACYQVPRRESHAWFRVTGAAAAAMFAKLCAVDLRAKKFAELDIAQTSVARLNAIVVRDDLGGVPAYHLLADSAAGEYLWRAALEAMAEFDGAPVGRGALAALTGV